MELALRVLVALMLMIPTITFTPITIEHKKIGVYDSSGDMIVFLSNEESSRKDVFIKDINTGLETRITNDGLKKFAPVVMNGNFIAWRQKRAKFNELVLCNLENSTKTVLPLSYARPDYFPIQPILTDKWLVWFERGHHNYLCACDLQTGKITQILKRSNLVVIQTVLVGDKVFYTIQNDYCSGDDHDGNKLYCYNLLTKEETVCNKTGSVSYLTGQGDWLAWFEYKDYGVIIELNVYQISKDRHYLVENPEYKLESMVMGDGYVVYSTYKDNLPGPLYKLNLNDELEPEILLSENSFRTNLKESNDLIFWEDSQFGYYNVDNRKLCGIHTISGIQIQMPESNKTQFLIINKNNVLVWLEIDKETGDSKEKVCKITIDKK